MKNLNTKIGRLKKNQLTLTIYYLSQGNHQYYQISFEITKTQQNIFNITFYFSV